MSAHTEGRLCYAPHGRYSDRLIVAPAPGQTSDFTTVALGIKREDARRLAACWNACDGIDTAALEALPTPWSKILARDFLAMVDDLSKASAKLAAARALLAEVLAKVEPETDAQDELFERIRTLQAGTAPTALELATAAIKAADAQGQVLTVRQVPRLPLAMGNYSTRAEVRPVVVRNDNQ